MSAWYGGEDQEVIKAPICLGAFAPTIRANPPLHHDAVADLLFQSFFLSSSVSSVRWSTTVSMMPKFLASSAVRK